ncbi:MAG: hypothetical protein ACJAVI_000440 [Candidatus Azotimanducaceae bacterium]|jgi:hypothetical protein
MKIRHIKYSSSKDASGVTGDLWLLSKGNKVLYRGRLSPWQSPKIIASALKREGKFFSQVA